MIELFIKKVQNGTKNTLYWSKQLTIYRPVTLIPLLGHGGRFFGLDDEHPSRGRRVSFSMEDGRKESVSHTLEPGEVSVTSLDDEDYTSDGEYGDGQDWDRREPEIICRHLDHVNMLNFIPKVHRERNPPAPILLMLHKTVEDSVEDKRQGYFRN